MGKHSKGNESSTSVNGSSGKHRADGSGTGQLHDKYVKGKPGLPWSPKTDKK